MTDTAKEIAPGVRWIEGDVEVDAPLIARGLNLPTKQFMVEMRRGIVYSIVEHGIGDDRGCSRLTFRYRDRVFRLIVTTTGTIICQERSGSKGLLEATG